jgi:predicted glycoside hydrolase/deacetylase ChbG (UPF0249 family)
MTDAASTLSRGSALPIRLVVNADDLGLSERINDGVVLAHRAGIVTACSLMAVGAAFGHAVAWCRRTPSLDVGVHLALVGGKPLRPGSSSLVGDDGRFPAGAGALAGRWLAGRIRPADVRAEWRAQIERILDHGIRLTHLDSHQHVHALPGLLDLALGLAARYRIPFVRAPLERPRLDRAPDFQTITRILGAAALGASWIAARAAGTRSPAFRPLRFEGFLDGGRLDLARLKKLITRLRPGGDYELMCHPGFAPEEPEVRSWQYRHEPELHALTHPSVRSAIAARGIRLCRFRDLARP